jgi:hypothetical protein
MSNNNSPLSLERLPAGLMEKVQQRWGIVYKAVDNEHQATYYEKPQLFGSPTAAAEAPQPTHDSDIDAARRQRAATVSAAAAGSEQSPSIPADQASMKAAARELVDQIHDEQPEQSYESAA